MEEWIKAAGIRAIKTVAQTAVAMLGACTVFSEVDVPTVLSASLLAGLLSLLTSVAGIPEAGEGASPLGRHAADGADNG